MSDVIVKWALGVATTLSAAAVLGIVTMWVQLSSKVDGLGTLISNMQATQPYQDNLRELEHGQMRQTLQILAQEDDVLSMKIESLERRIAALESRP